MWCRGDSRRDMRAKAEVGKTSTRRCCVPNRRRESDADPHFGAADEPPPSRRDADAALQRDLAAALEQARIPGVAAAAVVRGANRPRPAPSDESHGGETARCDVLGETEQEKKKQEVVGQVSVGRL